MPVLRWEKMVGSDRDHFPTPPLSAAVLAGGRSTRLGTDKALVSLEPGGPPLAAIVLARLHHLSDDVFLVSPSPPTSTAPPAPSAPSPPPSLTPATGIVWSSPATCRSSTPTSSGGWPHSRGTTTSSSHDCEAKAGRVRTSCSRRCTRSTASAA